MNEDTIADFKQFIAGLFDQHRIQLKTELKTELKAELKVELRELWQADFAAINERIDKLTAAIGDAIHDSNEENGAQLKDHEKRIVRLERKLA